MEKEVPGSAGWTITGDRSLEFANSPLQFVEKKITQYDSHVFLARALNIPTVFVCSNKGVQHILSEKEDSFKMGYRDFGYIHNLFGDLLLFYDDAEATRVRKVISQLFDPLQCHHYIEQVNSIADAFLSNLDSGHPVQLYETFKRFATAVSCKLFLDLDWREDKLQFDTITSIATLHWHGLISVPLSIQITGWSSSFSKAMKAKNYLLEYIRKKLNSCSSNDAPRSFFTVAKEAGFKDEEEASHHILLFVSALIPKALASMLTSFCIATSGLDQECFREQMRASDDCIDNALLEVQRLWPPFLGGRRIAKEDVSIDGYKIPKDTTVAFTTWFANRDPRVFAEADKFNPSRFQNGDKEHRNLVWTFGGGKRICVGYNLINKLLKTVCKKLLLKYDYQCNTGDNVSYKTLPVARPRQTVNMTFWSREVNKAS